MESKKKWVALIVIGVIMPLLVTFAIPLLAMVVISPLRSNYCGPNNNIVMPGSVPPVTADGLKAEQKENAALIIAIGVKRGLSQRDIQIALMTAYQESTLRNLSYGDRDSLGLYQQRPSQGWGTPSQILDPVYAINKFYDAFERVRNRDSKPLIEVAIEVQRPSRAAYTSRSHHFMMWEKIALQLLASANSASSLSVSAVGDETGIKYPNQPVGDIPAAGMSVGASTFGGFYDAKSSQFYASNNLQGKPSWVSDYDDNGKGNSSTGIVGVAGFAELSQGGVGNNNDALGGLPQFTKLAATYNGKTIIIEKRDQGAGQGDATVGGYPIKLDLWWEAAKLLDFKDGNGVIFIRPVDPSTPTTLADGTAMSAFSNVYDGACQDGSPNDINDQGWTSPLDSLRVGSKYGQRLHPILHYWRLHDGVDLSGSTGDKLYAMHDGTVLFAGSNSQAGNHMQFDYGNGIRVTYMHLSRFADGVQAGSSVTAGQLVGYVGNTGLSTAPHLHLKWRIDGQATGIDPVPEMCRRGITIPGPNGCGGPKPATVDTT